MNRAFGRHANFNHSRQMVRVLPRTTKNASQHTLATHCLCSPPHAEPWARPSTSSKVLGAPTSAPAPVEALECGSSRGRQQERQERQEEVQAGWGCAYQCALQARCFHSQSIQAWHLHIKQASKRACNHPTNQQRCPKSKGLRRFGSFIPRAQAVTCQDKDTPSCDFTCNGDGRSYEMSNTGLLCYELSA